MVNNDREDGPSSWVESRRLILSQLRTLDTSIKDLSIKIDSQQDNARERVAIISSETQKAISQIYVRLAMLEVSAKIWGGGIGLIGGAVSGAIIQALVSRAFH